MKSKRTKACEITQKTKEIVWNKDNKQCIFCGKYVPKTCANAHFIKRSAGGLGIPENIFTACINCHIEQDNGLYSKEYTQIAENYLKGIYGANWNKEKLIYNKWRERK